MILMDVQMPELDGLDATRAIREAERKTGKHTTIVAMTAHAMKGDKERCLEAGMDSYISKPVRASVLHQTLKDISEQREAGGAAVAPPEAPPSPPESQLNWSEAMESVGHDMDLLREVMEALVFESREMLEQLPRSIAEENMDETRRLAATRMPAIGAWPTQFGVDSTFRTCTRFRPAMSMA